MTALLHRIAPITTWAPRYERRDLRSDLAAGLTIGAMLVPQAMAYALLAGLPPEIGLYASIVPVLVYAVFGTSRQLAVGPVAIVSLMTASTLAPLYEQGSTGYVTAAALLALAVGAVHLVLGFGRLGFVVNFLSHSVLVGFTAAAAIIIGFSQVKHVLGISVPRQDHFYETVREVVSAIDGTNGTTLALGLASIALLLGMKRWARRVPSALVLVVVSILAVQLFDLEDRGVKTVGEIPSSLPAFGLPDIDGGNLGSLMSAALVITLVGFMESIAVAKVYARRHRYELDANQELVGLGMANVASGLFGGYPVTGGFSRTAVNDTAGARTPLASIVTALLVLATVVFFTPLFTALPQAALGAIIIVAVINLIDVREMRHIAHVKRSDLIGLSVAFAATLVLGIELGILVAVVASMLVVFARMSKPHSAELGRIPNSTSFRNVDRFPEVETTDGIRVIRIDAALSFVNANHVKRLCIDEAARIETAPHALVVDCSGINDIDATGVEALDEIVTELDEGPVTLHLCDVKGPVRDVLHRTDLWDRLGGRIHATAHEAVAAIDACVSPRSLRTAGIDEHEAHDTSTELSHA
ncbi:MAG: solute carrier family 26 protein [Ilumatobacter sp.]|uniref:SulP family inorganic anion transporter n=1 Tax=Ilumatobacter sp. TaxID=1967498 RepID=UPI0026219D00|nr:solute carrier family 26 protein [Ilumatobacter sp.]MDJ0768420.1 solute carrier family 26 protein [Ilumatobacter sp.]